METTDTFPVETECVECGFSLTVTEEDAEDVPRTLSPQYRARVVLEDHGWSNADERPLCSSCNS